MCKGHTPTVHISRPRRRQAFAEKHPSPLYLSRRTRGHRFIRSSLPRCGPARRGAGLRALPGRHHGGIPQLREPGVRPAGRQRRALRREVLPPRALGPGRDPRRARFPGGLRTGGNPRHRARDCRGRADPPRDHGNRGGPGAGIPLRPVPAQRRPQLRAGNGRRARAARGAPGPLSRGGRPPAPGTAPSALPGP